MQASFAYIRKELEGLYPPEETEGFISILFSHLKQYNLTDLLLKKEEILTPAEFQNLKRIVARLKQKEPIQYILGETEFYGLPFKLTPNVLIPRPETEELVEWVLKLKRNSSIRILDVGTGSGCIPIAVKKNWPQAQVFACDISEKALQIAKTNAGINQVEIAFFHLNILNPTLPTSFPKIDVLISNPPYVTESEKKRMGSNVLDHEPEQALFVPDDDPLRFYKALTTFAKKHLTHGGNLFWEINEAFGKECVGLLKENGFINVKLRQDINGKDRMLFAEFPKYKG